MFEFRDETGFRNWQSTDWPLSANHNKEISMPLIAPEKKSNNEQLNVTLPAEALADLRAYAKFLNDSSVSYVLTQLIGTLARDKEFQQWKTLPPTEIHPLATQRSKAKLPRSPVISPTTLPTISTGTNEASA
jgi:hypothetical protein